jgi:hypothetical protein
VEETLNTHTPEYTAWLADLQPGDKWKATESDGSFRGTRHVITITIVRKTNTQLIASVIEYAPEKHWITPTERRYRQSDGLGVGCGGWLPPPASAEEIRRVMTENAVRELARELASKYTAQRINEMHEAGKAEKLAEIADRLGWPFIAKGLRGEVDE